MLINIPAGPVIIKEGETNTPMYKIVSGTVELYNGYGTEQETILGIKSKDDYFGEMGLFSGGKPAIYTAVAYSDLLLMRITDVELEEFMLNNHVDVLRIMRNMADSMYSLKYAMDLYVEDLLKENDDSKFRNYNRFLNKQIAKYNAGFAMGMPGQKPFMNKKA